MLFNFLHWNRVYWTLNNSRNCIQAVILQLKNFEVFMECMKDNGKSNKENCSLNNIVKNNGFKINTIQISGRSMVMKEMHMLKVCFKNLLNNTIWGTILQLILLLQNNNYMNNLN